MKYYKIIVQNPKKDETVYTYLKSLGKSENYIVALRKSKDNIKLNNASALTNSKVKENDILLINDSPNTKTCILAIDMPLDIVYEDENMLIVNKPSGLSCMPNKSHYTNNLAGAVIAYMQKKDENFVLRIVNRLDKDTQGLILVAKNAFVYSDLSCSVKKVYHALITGQILNPVVIDEPIKTITEDSGKNIMKRVVDAIGKSAITYVTPIKVFKDATLVKLELTQGRTHQIRVHLSHISHSLIGDEIYGNKSDLISHTALVCKEMSVINPSTKQRLNFEIDYENDFKLLLEKLK